MDTMAEAGNVSDLEYMESQMVNSSAYCLNFSDNLHLLGANYSICDHAENQEKGSTPVLIAIIITAVYSIVCVIGVVGNVLVMYVIIR